MTSPEESRPPIPSSAPGSACEPAWVSLEHVSLGGLRVATAGRAELAQAMVLDCQNAQPGQRTRLVFDSNAHAISMIATDPQFHDAVRKADVVHADSGFVVLFSRLFAAKTVRERSATTDMIHDFAEKAVRHDLTFYLLGGTEEVNRDCARILDERYPSLKIVGRRNGYFRSNEEEAVLEHIRLANPDILWVGLGKPNEQLFCIRYADRLTARWAVTCGGCFNYVTGAYRRAPQWMQNINLEWFFRACTEWRLFRRYVDTSPRAIAKAITKRDRRMFADARELNV